MGFTDIFKTRQFKNDAERLSAENETQINTLNVAYQQAESKKRSELNKLDLEIASKKQQIITFDDAILVQEFGLYSPRFDFINSSEYKEKLSQIRGYQKACIKNGTAVSGNLNWTVNNNAAKGKKMVQDMQKLLLRAFNSECDETIGKIKYNNIDSSVKKINSSAAAISKLGTIMNISITTQYLDLKIQEAYLALEYQLKKQQDEGSRKTSKRN